ncbi:MAG: SGNH/GDSL hydrolase family protein [Bacteroidales bacterium]|nr:SGNH/GDSL hydrolase family protein [Candidatus Cryptobacteroides aphodequi]
MKRILIAGLCALMLCGAGELNAAAKKKNQTPKPQIESQWNGARVAFLGDSITDQRQVESGTNETYCSLLPGILGITPYVYGISGRTMAEVVTQAQKLEEERGQDIDAIFVFMGTNDYNHNIDMGEWFTYAEQSVEVSGPKQEVRLHREFNFDKMTFKGRINIGMQYLKTHYPTKQIILLTPIHRAYFYWSPENIQPDEQYANTKGLFIDDYVQAVKEAADIWAVPVLDIYSTSGLMPLLDEHHRYFRDNGGHDYLHPNTEGHRRIALTIARQLTALPVKFE